MTMQHSGRARKTKTFSEWSAPTDDNQTEHFNPRWHGANSSTSAETGIKGKPESNPSHGASYLCVSVVVFASVAALLKHPLSAQPCSPLWAYICGTDQRRLWKRRDQGSESPPSEQPRPSSAFPCVSHSPWSFQPAHQQPQSQGASIQGEGRCLEDWVGHGTVNRAPPPTCLTAGSGPAAEAFIYLMFPSCACVCVCVCVWFFSPCNYVLLPPLCTVCETALIPHC